MARRAGKKGKSKKKSQPTSLVERLRAVFAGFLFGSPVDDGTSDRLQEIKGLILIGISFWFLVSMGSYYTPFKDPAAVDNNWGGLIGFYLADGAFTIAGWAGYLVGVLGVAWGFVIVGRKQVSWPAMRMFCGLCFVLSVSFMSELAVGGAAGSGASELGEASSKLPYGPGGWLARQMVTDVLAPEFGQVGLWILLGLTSIISFMLATELAFYPAIAAAGEWLDERQEERDEALVVSAFRWFGGVLVGLWDFLRGADLAEVQQATIKADKAKKAKKTKAKSKAKSKKKSSKKNSVPEVQLEFDEEQDDTEAAEEEWEYEDEDDPDAEEEWEYEEDPDAAEYEEWEEEWEEEEVWEDEEPEKVIPPSKAKSAKKGKGKKAAKEVVAEEAEPEPEPKPAFERPARAVASKAPSYETPQPPAGPWTFPPLELLAEPSAGLGVEDKALEGLAKKLESALNSFRVEAEVVSAQVGPAVTMFEMTVPAGTRMNKVTALSQEIAAALKARSVRIIAPIPGRSTIGVEVPNKSRRMVRLRELINNKAYDKNHMGLPMFIGMDAEGNTVVEDLSKMPHLLIAGTTGSGKSVCINTILASLLLTRSPHDVQMVLVDPKMVELMAYSKVPHLMMPVVTDAKNATLVLNWLCEKMEGRYELMKDAKVRNLKSYNRLGEEKLKEVLGDLWNEDRTPRHLPYIVVVIDEMADLMMVSKKEAEGSVTRLLQKSRAAGIHLVVATQRPSTDVITGVLKGNLPTRMAFRVASKIDSRVILDTSGAEKLLGGGDMLYTPPGSSSVNRVQGAFLEDEELDRIVNFVANESAPNFSQEMVQTATGSGMAGVLSKKTGPDDPLWGEAVRVVLESKRGSASLLQRALQVGYTRASRLIDMMSEEGILGPHIGSKSRQILVTLEEWDAAHEDPLTQGATDE